MNWWQAIVLGVVEGLTEYLPVSSTGHLILTQRILGIPKSEASEAYAVCIQAGAIIAVLGLYWERVKQAAAGWLGKVGIGPGNKDGFTLGVNLIVAFVPAAVVGLLFNKVIKEQLFGLTPIVVAWLIGGLAILAAVWWKRGRSGTEESGATVEQLTWKMALAIGLIQCIAMMPGTSRSLVTIVGGVMVGLSLTAAVEFSFLLGVITLLAATCYEALEAGPVMVEAYGWTAMIIGSIAAWLSAVLAVKWMVGYLKKHGMAIFGYYRVALAVVVGGAIMAGVFKAPTTDVPAEQPPAARLTGEIE